MASTAEPSSAKATSPNAVALLGVAGIQRTVDRFDRGVDKLVTSHTKYATVLDGLAKAIKALHGSVNKPGGHQSGPLQARASGSGLGGNPTFSGQRATPAAAHLGQQGGAGSHNGGQPPMAPPAYRPPWGQGFTRTENAWNIGRGIQSAVTAYAKGEQATHMTLEQYARYAQRQMPLGTGYSAANEATMRAMLGSYGGTPTMAFQNQADAQASWSLRYRLTGEINDSGARSQAIKRATEGSTFLTPTMSGLDATQLVASQINPTMQMERMLGGFGSNLDAKGVYKGNAANADSLLRGFYGNRNVSAEQLSRRFTLGGIGWDQLVYYSGSEQAAEQNLDYMKLVARAREQGIGTDELDDKLRRANVQGDGEDAEAARAWLKDKFNLDREQDTLLQAKSAESDDMAREGEQNESFTAALSNTTDLLEEFGEVLNDILELPVVKELTSWWAGTSAAFPGGPDPYTQGMADRQAGPTPSPDGITPAPRATTGKGKDTGKNKDATGTDPLDGTTNASLIDSVIARAKSWLNVDYAYGAGSKSGPGPGTNRFGKSFNRAFDCSSFIQASFWQGAGIDPGRTTGVQEQAGKHVPWDEIQPGDIVVRDTGGSGHVGLYLGEGQMIHAPTSGKKVSIVPLNKDNFEQARRIIGEVDGTGEPSWSEDGDTDTTKDGTGSQPTIAASPAFGLFDQEIDMLRMFAAMGASGGFTGSSDASDQVDPEVKGWTPSEDVDPTGAGSSDDPDNETKTDRTTKSKGIDPNKVAIPAVTPGSDLARQNIAKAQPLAASYGWADGRDWNALLALWQKESSWNHKAENKGSGAYGIPQSLPGDKMAAEGADWRDNPDTQIKWGLKYIKGRYGDPEGAWAHSVAVNWYAKGAWELPHDQVATVHKGEMIIPAGQARTIRDALVEENLKAGASLAGDAPASLSGAGGDVHITFDPGSIQLTITGTQGGEQVGREAVRGMLAELEQTRQYRKIAKGL